MTTLNEQGVYTYIAESLKNPLIAALAQSFTETTNMDDVLEGLSPLYLETLQKEKENIALSVFLMDVLEDEEKVLPITHYNSKEEAEKDQFFFNPQLNNWLWMPLLDEPSGV